MWISTPISSVQTDFVASFQIVAIKDSPDNAYEVVAVFSQRQDAIAIYRGKYDACRAFKRQIDIFLLNGAITSLDNFFPDARSTEDAEDALDAVEDMPKV